ncbi:MAG: magnesium-translocating P-type ATPase [Thermodesulfobacteriota bacterium]
MNQLKNEFWSVPATKLVEELKTTPYGLTSDQAKERLTKFGPNLLRVKGRSDAISLLISQFKSPIILILIFASFLSIFLGDATDAFIILMIIVVSGLLGFWQEKGAANAVDKLLSIVQIKSTVLRDSNPMEIPLEEIVPGDILVLKAGDIIPSDCIILESKDSFVNEATLTGESYPVEKSAGVLPPETTLPNRTNALFMGTNVISGTADALVVHTGIETEFGRISDRLKLRQPETDFEHGVRRFGYLLMEVTLILVIATFALNVYFARPVMDSFLFSLALAVGLIPQLLPAIISINLAHGAKRMALEKVIVKRLSSIENFGSMNVLCSDKTGTLTSGIVKLHSALDTDGNESEKVLFYAYVNALYETGFANPIDQAIRNHYQPDTSGYKKLDEVPYDFIRKRLSILFSKDKINMMVTKGALKNVLSACTFVEKSDGTITDLATFGETILERFDELSRKGFRTLGIAYRNLGSDTSINKNQEIEMTFCGFIVLFDPPKPGVIDTINQLHDLGVSLKVITGDSQLVAVSLSKQVGLSNLGTITGSELRSMSDDALLKRATLVDIFAEVEPNQKERIILALKKAGNVVGYMGDGINDASALHVADVAISVDSAVDVAKEAADIVLLDMDLGVLIHGIREGRITFANTLKYVFMATSANFGNMFSMAGASLFLPFLPLLPKQILLTNLMTDFPEMTIATDEVDPEMTEQPRRWNINFIRNFMATFGIVSSVFDYVTFGVLLLILNASVDQFRTGWFQESVISASLIVLVIRTRKPFFKSKPSKYLFLATMSIVVATLILPYTQLAGVFNLQPLPASFLLILGFIVGLYIFAAELAKRVFYKRMKN